MMLSVPKIQHESPCPPQLPPQKPPNKHPASSSHFPTCSELSLNVFPGQNQTHFRKQQLIQIYTAAFHKEVTHVPGGCEHRKRKESPLPFDSDHFHPRRKQVFTQDTSGLVPLFKQKAFLKAEAKVLSKNFLLGGNRRCSGGKTIP